MTEIILSEKQKMAIKFLILRRKLDFVENQEYFNWANDLLQSDIFFHELAMIASCEYTEPNAFYHEDLNDNLTSAFRQLGFDEDYYDEDNAFDELMYHYCQQVVDKELDFANALEQINLLKSIHSYYWEEDIWWWLFKEICEKDEMHIANKKADPLYRSKVVSVMQDYINYFDNQQVTEFYQKHCSPPQEKKKSTIFKKSLHAIRKQ